MRNFDFNELEAHYLDAKVNGMDYSEIRKELRQKGMPEDDIKLLIRCVDNKLLEGYRPSGANRSFNVQLLLGILLFVGGAAVTIGTYTGWLDLRGYVLFAYGPMIGGLGLMVVSRRERSTILDRGRRMDR